MFYYEFRGIIMNKKLLVLAGIMSVLSINVMAEINMLRLMEMKSKSLIMMGLNILA